MKCKYNRLESDEKCECKTVLALTTMTNRAGATNAHTAPFFRDSQQLEGKSKGRDRQNT